MAAKTGNKNALKEVKRESYIHASCFSADKAKWVKTAQRHNLKLTQWIVKTLNNAVAHEKNS